MLAASGKRPRDGARAGPPLTAGPPVVPHRRRPSLPTPAGRSRQSRGPATLSPQHPRRPPGGLTSPRRRQRPAEHKDEGRRVASRCARRPRQSRAAAEQSGGSRRAGRGGARGSSRSAPPAPPHQPLPVPLASPADKRSRLGRAVGLRANVGQQLRQRRPPCRVSPRSLRPGSAQSCLHQRFC